MYVNTVAALCYSYIYDTIFIYNTVFKIKYKLYIASQSAPPSNAKFWMRAWLEYVP
jgi:predicted transglutaminase-like protease